MEGLLKRAIRLREELQVDGFTDSDELDDASGISPEDRREILQQIEQVANKNKISVTPELFRIKAMKKGFIMPLLVWIFAALLAVGAWFGLQLLFQARETSSATELTAIQNVEAEILEAQRREAESRLNEKDNEINSIAGQLQSIQSDLASLEANVESEVAEREAELRQALEEELEQERQRLQGQGLSEADVEAAIGAFRAEQNRSFEEQLQSFRAEQETERQAQEAALLAAQSDFNNRLQQANQEKASLEQEAQQIATEYEAELARLQEESSEQLSEATAEIERLNRLQEQEQSIANQLIGFYSRIRTDIGGNNYIAARNNLTLLSEFLDSEAFFAIDSLRQRRNTELFLVNSLDSLIASRERSTETQGLIESATILTEVERLVNQAQQAAQGGNEQRAQQVYEEALQLIPSVKNSYEYIQAQEASKYEKDLKSALDDLEADLQTNYDSLINAQKNDYENQLERAQDNNLELETELASQKQLVQTLQTQIASIQQNLDREGESLSETENELNRLERALELSQTQLEQTQADLEAEQQRVVSLSENQGVSSQEVQELQDRLSELEAQASELENQNQELTNILEQQSGDSIDPALIRELETLREQSIIYNNMVDAYQRYASSEDRVFASGSSMAMLQGKVLLDEFLSQGDVSTAFPGLSDRISVYDQEFEARGRENIMFQLSDLIFTVSSFADTQDRLTYIDEQRSLVNDEATQEFYDNLKFLLSN